MSDFAVRGLAGVEQAQPDGSFVAHEPGEILMPMPIRAGDRLRVRLEAPDDVWLYAIAVIRQADYWKLGAWSPGQGGLLWPGGRLLSADDATMESLIVVASREELPWASELVRCNCSAVVDKMPVRPPVTVCDSLYGLFWKIQPAVRGMVPPEVEILDDVDASIPAIVFGHRGAPYTALGWQFRQRD